MTLAHLSRAISELPGDAPQAAVHEILGQMRNALAAGLDAHKTELRDFLLLADKFGSYADAWNAAQLLSSVEPLDETCRAIQVSSWFVLFPEAARLRPKTVLSLLGESGTGGLSDSKLSGVLSRWLDRCLSVELGVRSGTDLPRVLLAAADLAECWWPPGEWLNCAPGFASSFVEVAVEVARQISAQPRAANAPLARALGLALLLRSEMQTLVDDEEADEDTKKLDHHRPTIDGVIVELNASRRHIWVVGALHAKWEHLVGIARSVGIHADRLQHIDYHDLKGQSLLERVDLIRDFGVLLGPIPHSVKHLDGYSSLATQLRQEAAIGVVELRAQSTSQELKITKSSFRSGLERLLADAAVSASTT